MALLSDTTTNTKAPFIWDRQIHPAVMAVTDDVAPPRAPIIGNARSGKSATLRHLQALLIEQGREVTLILSECADLSRVPPSHTLLVDDLHLVCDEQLVHLQERADDPNASLIVALRPAAWTEPVGAIVRRLERFRPAVVLGHLLRSDVLRYLEQRDQQLPAGCLERIFEMTSGVSWLVSEALRAHDDRDCARDPAHRELARALEEQVAHGMGMIDPELRSAIEALCIAPPGIAVSSHESVAADTAILGYAAGLLTRNGQPVPLVRSAVHATIPLERLPALSAERADELARSAASGDRTFVEWAGHLHDEHLGEALVRQADRMLESQPTGASELYRGAVQSGFDPAALAGRRAQAVWASGDFEGANTLIDSAPPAAYTLDGARLADTAAAIWAARGMLEQSCAVYRAAPPMDAISATRFAIAAFGIGSVEQLANADEADRVSGIPTALGVSMSLLRRGLEASVNPHHTQPVLADLVRAAEMYTSARTSAAITELPAVIAAVAAMNLGGLATAQSVLDDAIAGGHGGASARKPLLLWRAWVAVQRARPADARRALAEAADVSPINSPRNLLLAQSVQVAIARRYEDAAGLEAAWRVARGSILRVDVDLYLLHPLSELISSASRVGDTERIQPQFQRALELVERLGSPAMWSAHLHWAGIQKGILLNSPEKLRPHAEALVEASVASRVASTMARAGRVWTSVLGGNVDADSVEKAAQELAAIGLIWDAARLAGHGAARSGDRKISARLLACARELHPVDGTRKSVATTDEDSGRAARTQAEELLSYRELEVARLVLEGKTYAEIGETIFISPRTAEHHIAHIRHRLGATSRSEMIAKLRQLLDRGPARIHPEGADGTP